MKKLLATTALGLAMLASPAVADVTILNQLSGTGDNVVFDSFNGSNLAVGSFNGQHQGLVDFTCLATCAGFLGAANGNDIKIVNFSDLKVQVFDTGGSNVLATATDVFSVKGTGNLTVFVTANESGGGQSLFTFNEGALGSGQNGFTLTAINGETIDSFRVVDVGGTITDFEHYRIDVAASAVPEPATWFMMLLGFIGLAAAFKMKRRVVGFA